MTEPMPMSPHADCDEFIYRMPLDGHPRFVPSKGDRIFYVWSDDKYLSVVVKRGASPQEGQP